jgi:predicted component of type VI protein secretion system
MKLTLTLALGDNLEKQPFVIEVPDNPRLEPEVLIGRADDCDMQIVEAGVSRHHCGIVVDAAAHVVRVRDRGSANGTFVNDQRVVGMCDVHDGDKLTVGSLPLRIGIPEESTVWERAAERCRQAQVGRPIAFGTADASTSARGKQTR